MNWNNDMELTVRNSTATAKGTACYFVKLTASTGLKLYGTPYERDASWIMQSIGAEHDIAPSVGQCVDLDDMNIPAYDCPSWWNEDFKNKEDKTLYGYLTEIVDTTPNQLDEYDTEKLQDQAQQLGFDAMADLGHYTDNVGIDNNGTFVIVDWDGRFGAYGLLTPHEVGQIEANYSSHSLWDRVS